MNQYVVIGTCFNNCKVAKIVFAKNTGDAIVRAIEHERTEGSGANFHSVEAISTYDKLSSVGSNNHGGE